MNLSIVLPLVGIADRVVVGVEDGRKVIFICFGNIPALGFQGVVGMFGVIRRVAFIAVAGWGRAGTGRQETEESGNDESMDRLVWRRSHLLFSIVQEARRGKVISNGFSTAHGYTLDQINVGPSKALHAVKSIHHMHETEC